MADLENYADDDGEETTQWKPTSKDITNTVEYEDDSGRTQRAPVDFEPHFEQWRANAPEGRMWQPWKENTKDYQQHWLETHASIVRKAQNEAIEKHKARQTSIATGTTAEGAPAVGSAIYRATARKNERNKISSNARRILTTGDAQYGSGWREGWEKASVFGSKIQTPVARGPVQETKPVALDDDPSAHAALEDLGNRIHAEAPDTLKANKDFAEAHRNLLTNLYHSAVAHQVGRTQKAKALSHFASAVSNVQELARMRQGADIIKGVAPAGGGVAPEVREAHNIHMGYLRRPWNR